MLSTEIGSNFAHKMTYNAKVYDWDLKLAKKFLDNGIAITVFDSFDGGGWTGHIIEFQRRDELKAYIQTYLQENAGSEVPSCWIEHDDGKCEPFEFEDIRRSS